MLTARSLILVMDDYNVDIGNLPDFNCLCELCDCGCFEASKQPHSITCQRFFNQRKPTGLQRSNSQSAACRVPKGQLSEYQYQYLNSKEHARTEKNKIKDNIDIFSRNGKPQDFNSGSARFNSDSQLRSKVLDRLSRMMPNNENISWYKAENNFFGHNDVYNKNDSSTENLNPNFKTIDNHKNDYLKKFEEYNRGFVDTYSEKRGSELVSVSRTDSEFQNNTDSDNANIFKSNSGSISSFRAHDFRSPWIPKKYSGRNMFVSHIDSALFPDKIGKDIDINTHYNHFHTSNPEKKQAVLTEKPPYQKLDKSVRFQVTNDNKYIPTIITLPRKEPLYEANFHEKPKSMHVSTEPTHSTYQGDYERPKSTRKNHTNIPLCKAAAVQGLMRRDKMMNGKLDKNSGHTLESLRKRGNEIDTILMQS